MRNFLISERITLNPDQDISEIKEFLKQTISQVIELDEITAGNEHFLIRGTTGGLFDFIRNAKVYADFDLMAEDSKTSKELRIFVKGNAVLSYSMMLSYLVLFCLILFAGLLPGSIETDSENSTALDALIFLIIGYYIKTEIDKGLLEAEKHIEDTIKTLKTRFEI